MQFSFKMSNCYIYITVPFLLLLLSILLYSTSVLNPRDFVRLFTVNTTWNCSSSLTHTNTYIHTRERRGIQLKIDVSCHVWRFQYLAALIKQFIKSLMLSRIIPPRLIPAYRSEWESEWVRESVCVSTRSNVDSSPCDALARWQIISYSSVQMDAFGAHHLTLSLTQSLALWCNSCAFARYYLG